VRVAASQLPAEGRITTTENARRREGGIMLTGKYETEAVFLQITNDEKNGVTCQLKPFAGGTAIKIDGKEYLVGRFEADGRNNADNETVTSPIPIAACLWQLNKSGTTETKFILDKKLHEWSLAAWQAQRKVSLVVDVQDEKNNRITQITLL
jgi:hypothetical protein